MNMFRALQVLGPNVLWLYLFLQYALAISTYARTQYIWYGGVLTGRFLLPATASSNCSNFDFTKMGNATMSVGVNPPWDKNPFYWQLENQGTPVTAGAGEVCYGIGGCTSDSIFNFYFATADYRCFKDGVKCTGITFGPFYYEALQMVDLSAAKVTPFTDGGANGYSVIGDPGKFVSNGTVQYNFDLQTPKNYSTKCPVFGPRQRVSFSWINDSVFSYGLNFTNTTISANITLTTPTGTLVMLFSGSRHDDTEKTKNGNDPYNKGNYTPISLDTSDAGKPQFRFVNGSRVSFKDIGNNEYSVSSVNSAERVIGARLLRLTLILVTFLCIW